MSYLRKYENYKIECYENSNFPLIKKLLIGILGRPKNMGKLSPYIISKSKKEYGEGYQVRLTPKQLIQLQKRLFDNNIRFEEFFEREWCHLHLSCYLGNDDDDSINEALYHEAIAYEHEEYWSIYYEDGSLTQLPQLKNEKYFIQNIYNININEPSIDLQTFFEDWTKKQVTPY